MNIHPPPGDRCWSRIGVWGDHSCPELKSWVHCQNCPVLSTAGRSLFDRPPPPRYLEEWSRILAEEHEEQAVERESILVFRIGVEWLGLSARLFQSIEELRVIRPIPHRSSSVLLGLVNIQGGLQLCISLRALLEIPESAEEPDSSVLLQSKRLAYVSKAGERWVFPVDGVLGVHRYRVGEMQDVPVTVTKAGASLTRGILNVDAKRVGLLDEELMFYHLKRTALG